MLTGAPPRHGFRIWQPSCRRPHHVAAVEKSARVLPRPLFPDCLHATDGITPTLAISLPMFPITHAITAESSCV